MPNKTPIILQKISHLNLMCPHIIVWRHDLIMSFPPECTDSNGGQQSMHPHAQHPSEYFIKPYSPLIRSESCMSFGMIITLLAWIAHKFASSKSPTLKASTDSCIANNDVA